MIGELLSDILKLTGFPNYYHFCVRTMVHAKDGKEMVTSIGG